MLRTAPRRAQVIAVYGATSQSEAAVRAGLDWLARHQAADGHWGPDCLQAAPNGRCEGGSSCGGPGGDYRIAQTGLALLAFQAGGHYDFNKQKYSAVVRRGLDWLIAHQQEDGRFTQRLDDDDSPNDPQHNLRFMYQHGMAAFAMTEACAVAVATKQTPDDRYHLAAARAIRFIEEQQHEDGGWRYTENELEPSDVSVSGWQVLALKTAKQAKISVSDQCVRKVEVFFKSCELRDGRTGYMRSGESLSDATTGVGMLVHQFILDRPDSPLVKAGASYLADVAERSRTRPSGSRSLAGHAGSFKGSYYAWYNCTLAMFQAGGEPWKRWNDVVRDLVIKRQRQDSKACLRGSWDPDTQWDDQGGRIYSTALAVLILEVYYRYHSERARIYAEAPPGR